MGSNSRRAFIFTYGCQMNVYESAVMKRILQRRGYLLADSPDEADLVILNTCSVRNRPERKVFGQLAELSKAKASRPQMKIVVSGCMAQLRATELRRRFPLDGIFGPRNLGEFAAFLEREEQGREQQVIATCLESHPFVGTTPAVEPGSASAFVSIMEGCSNFCSYCIVPYVRGPELSRPVEDVLSEVKTLVAEGVKEVTLLGQNVNAYGRDVVAQGPSSKKSVQQQDGCAFRLGATGPPSRWADFSPACSAARADLKVCATPFAPQGVPFSELLRRVCQVQGLVRLRFTTSHPKDFGADIIRAVAELPQACEHFHLPIQSGDDEILRRMGRGYTLHEYRSLVAQIRAAIPHAAISTDVMVGFPAETDEQFGNTLSAFEETRFDQAFMFIYGDRPGTAAAQMEGKVSREVAVQRLQRLSELQNRISREINEAQVGGVFEVLTEGPSEKNPALLSGRTRTNKLVHFPGSPALQGKVVQVRAEKAHLWGFIGQLVT